VGVAKGKTEVEQAFAEGAKYVLEVLAEVMPEVKQTDVWREFINE
jgi:hypothetical protein